MLDISGVNGSQLFHCARRASLNVAYFLPRTTKTEQLGELGNCEVELQYLNSKLKAICAYFGRSFFEGLSADILKPVMLQNGQLAQLV